MIRVSDAFPDLEALYQALPPVPCEGCGSCCVTPHLTLVEFAYLLRHLENNFSRPEMITLLQAPMVPAAHFAGNFLCPLQDRDGLCRVYPARSLSCRAEGLPVIDSMSGREAPACRQSEQKRLATEVTEAAVRDWLSRLSAISMTYHAFYEEPYFLNSLNIECWFAVMLDPKIRQPFFIQLRNLLKKEFNSDFLTPYYTDHTNLAGQLDLIDKFFHACRRKRPRRALAAMRRVIEEFPGTGSYYQYEGREFLNQLFHVEP
ncbi:MAG: YkgJ family cysteine cluster protein [Desulfobaccales bacterium]